VSSLLHTVRAVAWSFIGIRKNSEYQKDLASLNPLHIVLVAIVAVILIVLALVGLVHWVVR
jgi:heme/copper-type cytochrome/quinol oxidase subunit 2